MCANESLAFLRQTVANFRTTGAVAPSSRVLANAMVRHLPQPEACPEGYQVVEVGAGTGPFTAAIAERLRHRGCLHVWELNPSLFAYLEQRVAKEDGFAAARGRIQLHQGDILSLNAPGQYDAVISGLPFNNFRPEEVQRFLEHFAGLLKPGGTLSFFEYLGMRRLKSAFVGGQERRHLREIGRIVRHFARSHQVGADIVFLNIPPARVRHFRMPAPHKAP